MSIVICLAMFIIHPRTFRFSRFGSFHMNRNGILVDLLCLIPLRFIMYYKSFLFFGGEQPQVSDLNFLSLLYCVETSRGV